MLLIHPKKTQTQHFTAITAYFHISFISLYTHRTRESRPLKLYPVVTPAWVGGQLSFWGAQLYTNTIARLYVYDYILVVHSCTITFLWCALPYDYF
jgi:hypothetical protein